MTSGTTGLLLPGYDGSYDGSGRLTEKKEMA